MSNLESEIRKSAEIAALADDIKDFPYKYEQLVGERGITLSGGQKQRTAIARAVMRNPRILILDDSLSAVDTYTEEKILERLARRSPKPHDFNCFAPHFDRPRCRFDLRSRRRKNYRTRNARRIDKIRRRICRFISTTTSGRRIGGDRIEKCVKQINPEMSNKVIAH
jgi:hypothetical protein